MEVNVFLLRTCAKVVPGNVGVALPCRGGVDAGELPLLEVGCPVPREMNAVSILILSLLA